MKQGYGLLTIGYWLIAAVLIPGCANDDEYATTSDPVSVELAYSFSSSHSGNLTRQAVDVVTSDRPPSLSRLMLISYVNNKPAVVDASWENPISKTNPRANFYYTHYCALENEVNAIHVYGDVDDMTAPTGVHSKMYNGSLIKHFPTSITTVDDVEDISFKLEPIYKSEDHPATEGKPEGIPAGAQTLADCLTAIATTSGFNTSGDVTVKAFFETFTNQGKPLPGSAASVRKWIETFRTSISNHLNSDAPSILDAVDTEASNQLTAIESLEYPRELSLPDGAAVLRWDGENAFKPQINTTTIININSMARFAFPASLYYYVASPIRTSNESVDLADIYNNATSDPSKTAWQKVIENEAFTGGDHVTSSTRAVVLDNPVQYAVAQLKVSIKASASSLPDAATPTPNSIAVDGEKFPLKGIIVCDQRPVDHKFEPKEPEPGTSSDADVLFIYDNQVVSDCYLTNQSGWLLGCNTLVLQSLKDEDVHIILEFENKSGQSFTCIDGEVYPDTRFYLIGRVQAHGYNEDPYVSDKNRSQVFTKDYITYVNMTVSSLAKAYNVPPNLLSPNLEIGVETTSEWVGATPTVKRLE